MMKHKSSPLSCGKLDCENVLDLLNKADLHKAAFVANFGLFDTVCCMSLMETTPQQTPAEMYTAGTAKGGLYKRDGCSAIS